MMNRINRWALNNSLLVSVSCILVALGPLAAASQPEQSPAERRLATKFAQAASLILMQDPLTVEAIESANLLMLEAANLTPGDVEMWRLAHAASALAENDQARLRSVAQIVALDPADDGARLEQISHQLLEHQTAEELAVALEEQLTKAQREGLSPAVLSRLALDLALLERRRGNDHAFADRLAQAASLDPSHQAAAALAAGYFQMHVDDVVAEAELLLQLVLANPLSVESVALLAAHMLNSAAYAGAEQFYDLAIDAYTAMNVRAPADLVADAAIAQFGRGNRDAALRRLFARQREENALLHQQLQRARPDLTPRDRANYVAAVSPIFATVRAAIHHRMDDNVETQTALAAFAYSQAIRELEENQNVSEAERRARIAMLRLEQAWTLIWLGGDLERVDEVLEEVRGAAELSSAAELRFQGWKALREREFQHAADLLEDIAPEDAPARLGYAMALLELGERREGARELLGVARAQPGTLIGVYAADILAELLGTRAPLTSEAVELDRLASTYPRGLHRAMSEPTTVLGFRLVPVEQQYEAHEPILLNIEITNNSPVPLAIDPQGPVLPEVALLPSVQIVQARVGALPPIVVSIDRRLRLMPRERLIIPVDLRRSHVGDVLDRYAILGAIVRVRGVINFRATLDGSIVPALLGSDSRPPSMWVSGVRPSPQWMQQSVTILRDVSAPTQDLTRLALFGLAVSGEAAPTMTEEQQRLLQDAREAVAEAFARADGTAQAWLISVWPASFLEAAIPIDRYANDRLVTLAHLMYRSRRRDDPMVGEAMRSDDPTLRQIASFVAQRAEAGGDDEGVLRLPDERTFEDPSRSRQP